MSMPWWDLVVKSFVVSAFGFGTAVLLLRRSSAAARHLVLTLTLVGLLSLPILAIFLPRWENPFVRVTVKEAAPVATFADAIPTSAAPSEVAVSPATSPIPLLLGLWAVVAAGLVLRVTLRVIRLRALERRLEMTTDPTLTASVAAHCRRARRHVLLLEGAPNEPPMTWGHFRPVLLLPGDAGTWAPGRLNSVVLHELAHIERGDWLASVVGQITCALYWFNPFVWLIANRMTRESESAADDRVLGQGFSAVQYATHLIEVLRDLRRAHPSGDAALAMARPGILDGRVRAILEEKRCRRPVRGAAALGVVTGLGLVVAVIAAAGPTLVREASRRSPGVTLDVTRLSSKPAAGTSDRLVASKDVASKKATASESGKPSLESERSAGASKGRLVLSPKGSTGDRPATANRPSGPPENVPVVSGPVVATSETPNRPPASMLQVGGKPEGGEDQDDLGEHLATLQARQAAAKAMEAELEAGLREAEDEFRRAMEEARRSIEEVGGNPEQLKIVQNALEIGRKAGEQGLKVAQGKIILKSGQQRIEIQAPLAPDDKPDKDSGLKKKTGP